MRAWRFSSVRSLSRPDEVLVQRAGVRLDHRLDRDLTEVDAERLGQPCGIAARGVRRIARRHRDTMDAFGAQRLDAQRRRQGRVDAPRETEHDVPEAVLLHVVVEPQLECETHLLEVVELRDDPRRPRIGLVARRREVELGQLDRDPLARQGAPAHISQPAADCRSGIDVDDEELLDEPGGTREHLSLVVEHDGVPVEDQLVLSADRIAEGDETRIVERPHAEHLLALSVLADVERRRRDVRDQLRAAQREVGRRRPGLPDVLADRRADAHVAEAQEKEVVARREVAIFVEDAVVRQVALAVDTAHLAVLEHVARVVEVGIEIRRADEHGDAVRRLRDLVDRPPCGAHETGAEQQVLRRVAGDHELGKEDQVGVRVPGLLQPIDDAGRVAVDVADDAIDLGECESHRFSPLGRKLYHGAPAGRRGAN